MINVLVVSNLLPSVAQPGRGAPLWNYVKHLSRIARVSGIGARHYAAPFSRSPLQRAVWATPRQEVFDGVTIAHPRYLVIPRVARGVQGWSYRAMLARQLDALPADQRPDVILSLWAYPDAYAAVLEGHRRGIPVVAMVIGSDVNALPAMGLEPQVRTALTEADRVITVCEDLRRVVESLGAHPRRTDVVLNGVELERFQPGSRAEARRALGLASDEDIVLCLGNLYPVKGPDVLLAAWPEVLLRRPSARLVFVGDGPMQATLRQRARVLGIDDRVTFAGRRPHEEVPLWHQAANVTAIPSRSEGIPNVLLEALACGTPVVATRVGGIPEALPERGAGTLVPKEDPRSLAAAITDTIGLGLEPRSVRAVSQLHPWSDAAALMLESLERAIAERKARARE